MSPPEVELAPGIRTGPGRLPIVAGPCVIETAEQTLAAARAVAAMARRLEAPVIFKASFDKANRSSLGSFRGPGLGDGLEVLAAAGAETGLPLLTDVHAPEQCAAVAEVCAVLQVPAFLCRQTDLIVAAAETGRAVNIKKGQFMAPGDMRRAVEKAMSTGNERITVTERGVTFGYRNLVVDMRAFELMHDDGIAVIYDVTHSLQLPGAAGDETGGDHAQVAVVGFGRVQEERRRAGGGEGRRQLLHDQPALAHAGRDHPAAAVGQQVHRRVEAVVELTQQALDGGGLDLEDLARHGAGWAGRLAHGRAAVGADSSRRSSSSSASSASALSGSSWVARSESACAGSGWTSR